ncbi:hypothetical protein [Bradyrhizobium commune]|uniref:Uncharacterized protein n=1 Tax=Bradyrhizobium commune TaxID=83627 RepID=A0A7S9D013_9BRAD|nr:hypothetical protein [Bradyrhizobium commune]QPF88688.1 hypothetical protein IC761_19345 [Bradyrhizobium commune]
MAIEHSKSDGQLGISSAATAPPPWIRRTTPYAPDRRARMLEHMARARSQPQSQAATSPSEPADKSVMEYVVDFAFRMILFGLIGLVFQSRFPLCLGLFFFFTDGEFIEWVLRKSGIRFEPDAIGPDIVRCFVSWFGWGTLLASWKSSAPQWLMSWMPPGTSWSFIAVSSLLLAIVDAVAATIMRRALPWFGLKIGRDSLAWTPIQFLVFVGLLAPLILFDYSTSTITRWLAGL